LVKEKKSCPISEKRYFCPMRFLPLLLCLLLATCQSPKPKEVLNLVPWPAEMTQAEGDFTLTHETVVRYPNKDDAWKAVGQFLTETLRSGTGWAIADKPFDKKVGAVPENAIWVVPDERITAPEGYVLEVKPAAVLLRAKTTAGAFYGIQTLLQLFPPEIMGRNNPYEKKVWKAPACRIADQPRFPYRGLHLDVGRHFFSVPVIKRYIDLMAHHKFNVFHWHLTEDQGWRIEIKKRPLLTEVGSCRKETMLGSFDDQPRRFDGKKYCGFYTQKEISEVVAYAQKRFVTIVPEIELPGHSLAALAAYPALGCTGGPYQVRTEWGVSDEVMCAGNDQTFVFWEEVLDEVCTLFPGPYVHIGGDECPKTRWKTCSKCQQRIKTEKLADEHALQSYCIRRVEDMLTKRGKKLIGWDEILEGGLPPAATVMSWRGTEGGIAAAQAGHDVVMTPGSHCYFDFYQGDAASEPLAIGGFTPLEKVYAYEPVPEELTAEQAKHVLGAQGNVWTEYISTPDKVEYMVYPRACAMAEVLWTPKEMKNADRFFARMRTHFQRLEALRVPFARNFYDVQATFSEGNITLTSNDPDVTIRYTLDGSLPSEASKLYKGLFTLKQSATIQTRAYRNHTALGNIYAQTFWIHKAVGKPYTLSRQPERYTGGSDFGLTNGVTGTLKTWNKWVGVVNNPLDPTIDFGTATAFSRVTTHYIDSRDNWIYAPLRIEALTSDNGTDFVSVAVKDITHIDKPGSSLEKVVLDLPAGTRARYLKIVVSPFGVIPEGASGAGSGAWLFLDEVMVE
jgi:hexosaminidase